jgi:hypothetical protein
VPIQFKKGFEVGASHLHLVSTLCLHTLSDTLRLRTLSLRFVESERASERSGSPFASDALWSPRSPRCIDAAHEWRTKPPGTAGSSVPAFPFTQSPSVPTVSCITRVHVVDAALQLHAGLLSPVPCLLSPAYTEPPRPPPQHKLTVQRPDLNRQAAETAKRWNREWTPIYAKMAGVAALMECGALQLYACSQPPVPSAACNGAGTSLRYSEPKGRASRPRHAATRCDRRAAHR